MPCISHIQKDPCMYEGYSKIYCFRRFKFISVGIAEEGRGILVFVGNI